VAQDYRKFLSPQFLSKLSRMEMKARLVVEGFLIGLHRSPYHGFSVEFAEHRQYMPGDPIRDIDWKVYAKTDRYYIKEYEEETNLKAYILLDASASMGYSSNGVSKLEYGSYLSAALGYLMLKQKDAVGLAIFDEGMRSYLPPRSARSHLHDLLKDLVRVKPSRTTQVSSTFHQMAERIKRRGLVVIISDLFSEPEDILMGLKHFRYKKNEVIVFHILDPMEKSFAYQREAIFVDMETREEVLTQPWQIRGEYQREIRDLVQLYKTHCGESRIEYVSMDTSVPLDYALFAYLQKRKRLF
jgi:uncharacterized protein (DUF58 family)